MSQLDEFLMSATGAFKVLFKGGFYNQALVVLYSAIDTLAWVDLEEEGADVTKKDFIGWAEAYMPMDKLPCTASDLYAARCGLVHSNSAESRMYRKGEAKQIWYYMNDSSVSVYVAKRDGLEDVINLSILDLHIAFLQGAEKFIKQLSWDPDKLKRASDRMAKFIHWV